MQLTDFVIKIIIFLLPGLLVVIACEKYTVSPSKDYLRFMTYSIIMSTFIYGVTWPDMIVGIVNNSNALKTPNDVRRVILIATLSLIIFGPALSYLVNHEIPCHFASEVKEYIKRTFPNARKMPILKGFLKPSMILFKRDNFILDIYNNVLFSDCDFNDEDEKWIVVHDFEEKMKYEGILRAVSKQEGNVAIFLKNSSVSKFQNGEQREMLASKDQGRFLCIPMKHTMLIERIHHPNNLDEKPKEEQCEYEYENL